jgi:hypothetical protein
MNVKREWLDADDGLYHRVVGFLESNRLSVDAIAGFGKDDTAFETGPRDLGFGASLLRRAQFAGTATVNVDAIVFDERVARLDVQVSWSSAETFALARPRYLAILGLRLQLDDGERRARTVQQHDEVTVAALHAARARALGAVPVRDVPAPLQSAYAGLTTLGNAHVVGDRCGYVGSPAAGSLETRALAGARRADLLADVLRGPNPEARVYAARALLAGFGDTLEPADRAAINIVRDLAIPILACSGCTHWDTVAAKLIE